MNAQTFAHLAFTLGHFIWQGAAIALLAMVLKGFAGRSAEWRYRISVGALALMFLAPLMTFAFYPAQNTLASAGWNLPLASVAMQNAFTSSASGSSIPWTVWVVLAWFSGVVLLCLRLLLGWKITQGLARTASNAIPENARVAFERLTKRVRWRQTIQLLISDRVPGPVVIGWLKPVILLPLAAASNLGVEQLEAILAHELAHIRRHDFLVNVLQCCAECLLFYHPAVWWMSSEIRREREHCCDDLAIAICGDRAAYATALVELESARSPMLAMAASGSDLARRIRRIVGQENTSAGWKDAALVSVLAIAVLIGAVSYGARAQDAAPRIENGAKARAPARNQNAVAIFHGTDRTSHSPDRMENGRNVDLVDSDRVHKALGGRDMIWYRFGETRGIIEDKATIERILALYPKAEPMDVSKFTPEQRAALDALNAMPQPIRLRELSPEKRAEIEKLMSVLPRQPNVTAQVDDIVQDAINRGLSKPVP
jgi:beta-lactamase regulating signal transducer with metallopeptidase domain